MSKQKTISCGIIIRHRDKYLLGKQFVRKDNNAWTVFKGGQESDETMLDTAIRELYEESNIEVENRKNITSSPIFSYFLNKSKKRVFVFLLDDVDGVIYQKQDIKCNSFFKKNCPEITDYQWFTLDEVEKKLMPSQKGLVYVLKVIQGRRVEEI